MQATKHLCTLYACMFFGGLLEIYFHLVKYMCHPTPIEWLWSKCSKLLLAMNTWHCTHHWSMHVGRIVLTHWGGKRKITAKQGHRQHCKVTCADEWTLYTSLFVYFFLTLMLLSPSQLGINRTWQVVNIMHFNTIPLFSYAIIPHSHCAGIVRCFLLMTMD